MPYSDSDTWGVDDSSHLNFYEKGHFVRLSWRRGSKVNWYTTAPCLIVTETNYPECWVNCLLICSLFLRCHLSSGPFLSESIASRGKGALSLTASTSWKIDHYCIWSSINRSGIKTYFIIFWSKLAMKFYLCVCVCVWSWMLYIFFRNLMFYIFFFLILTVPKSYIYLWISHATLDIKDMFIFLGNWK